MKLPKDNLKHHSTFSIFKGGNVLNPNTYLELRRSSQYVNKIRNFKVMINNFERGTIEDGGTLKIEIEPGEYEVYLKIDWCRSNKIKFSIENNENIKLKCGCPIKGWKYLNPFIMPYYVFFNKDKYLYLKIDE